MTSDTVSQEDQVNAAYAAWDTTFNTGDVKSLASLYTEDALFLPATHDIIEGPTRIEEFFESLFASGVTGHRLALVRTTSSDGDGNLVVAAARWSALAKNAGVVPIMRWAV
jgi:uncharacterized protein (TIGR02246 family)